MSLGFVRVCFRVILLGFGSVVVVVVVIASASTHF